MGRSRDRSYSRSRSRSRSGSLSSTSSGRTAKARNWNGEGGHRLHLSDLAMGVSRREIEKLFRPYGPLNEVWVASNPPCFAFINFRHRADGERALKEVDGKVVGGSRVGLSWARQRNYGGRPRNALLYRSPSPPYRRGYRDSYSSRRSDDRYSKRRYSRSRSRSPGYRRSGRNTRRRSSSSRSRTRSPSPRDIRREKRTKTSGRDDERHSRRRRHRSESKSDSHSSDHGSPNGKNEKRFSRSPVTENHQAKSTNGNNHHSDIDDHHVDIELNERN
ncbi:unnamed protein product [Adineta steineri]|uniref:RRM domain-containing protein n=1 Tax=Adineta steineri TaxID=433720 RepID=A0A814C660_9BILA|nr:unnamed protein product [Adineta steineri]CAF3675926.1 unnamed protein product [Adineta steineri]